MNVYELFLAALKAALEGRPLMWEQEVSLDEWQQFFDIAGEQNVLPMVYESIYSCEAFRKTCSPMIPALKRSCLSSIYGQIQKTQTMMDLYRFLTGEGLTPIVVKGIMVRMLHPNPDARISGDEDFYIPEGTYPVYKAALQKYGMKIAEWDAEKEDVIHEVSYVDPTGTLQIEIHKDLFDAKLSAFQGMNDLFDGCFDRSIMVDVDGLPIRSMNHSDHMLFLILHAFKHFVSSGFGIRQVCDMVVYGNHYGKEIDWDYLYKKCKSINAELFASAIFVIGKEYLGFDYEASGYSSRWQELQADPSDLLDDLFKAGIFGGSSSSRRHSANITLHAVGAEKEGRKSGGNLLRTIFPPKEILEGRFAYLKKMPFLLPVAWVQRILVYSRETAGNKSGNNAAESIQIGNERVELMRKYGIIK